MQNGLQAINTMDKYRATVLIHGWYNKDKAQVRVCYPNGQRSFIPMDTLKKVSTEEVDKIHEINFGPIPTVNAFQVGDRIKYKSYGEWVKGTIEKIKPMDDMPLKIRLDKESRYLSKIKPKNAVLIKHAK